MNKNFFGVVKLEDYFSNNNILDIEMLRVGDFEHKAYGKINITNDMLKNMIDNFYSNVVGREISFDWNHKAEEASAWLKDVRQENGILIG
jgi:hypothetical protein